MDFQNITERYYSKWLGAEDILCPPRSGVEFVYSPERNAVQPGYGQRFDLYAVCRENFAVLSYGDRLRGEVDELRRKLSHGHTVEETARAIGEQFGVQPQHLIKYVYMGGAQGGSTARVLGEDDFSAFRDFFVACNPGCENIDWLQDYFSGMAGLCCGVFADGRLVSCTDAPDMPYMGGEVREIGINTHPDYRKRGYAADAVRRCIAEIIAGGRCPMWSTSVDNIPSRRLAEKVGFAEFADVLTLSL